MCCMYICMYVYMICMYIHDIYYVCMYVCMYVCTYVHTYVRMCMCMHACIHALCICVYVCVHILLCIPVLKVCVVSNRAVNMFYGGFGSMSYSTSEEPSNIDLEASEYTPCLSNQFSISSCTQLVEER